jgi:hypothetical protein
MEDFCERVLFCKRSEWGDKWFKNYAGRHLPTGARVGMEFIPPNSLQEAAREEGHLLTLAHPIYLAYRSP